MTSPVQPRAGDKRVYRRLAAADGLTTFQVTVQETDLMIQAERDLSAVCREEIIIQRGYIEQYIQQFPTFRDTLAPWEHGAPAPEIIRRMILAGAAAGVGPMASVAGAIAEAVGASLRRFSREVIVENGGDIFIALKGETTVGLYAGRSPLSMRIGLRLNPGREPLAVCTSSGTVGHSLSLGRADAVCVVARECALADAAATAVANRIPAAEAIPEAIGFARSIAGLEGVVAICGERVGLWGDLRIVKIDRRKKA